MMNIMLMLLLIVVVLIVCFLIYKYVAIKYIKKIPRKKVHLKILEQKCSNNTIMDMLKWCSDKHPDYEALKHKNLTCRKWKSVNYSEYFNNVERFAKCLKSKLDEGITPRVAIIGFNTPEWFYSHLGTMMAGGVSVGMYPTSDSKTCEYIIKHSKVNVLVVEDTKQLEKFTELDLSLVKTIVHYGNIKRSTIEKIDPNIKIIKYIDFTREIGSGDSSLDKVSPQDMATIIYTSGTTGEPKGVVVRHYNIIDILNKMILTIHMKSDLDICVGERFISYLPLNHIAAQMMDIYVPIVTLGTVYFAKPDALKGSLGETLSDVNPTIFVGVPRVWEKIMEKIKKKLFTNHEMAKFFYKMAIKKAGLSECKFAITAAAPISNKTRDDFKKLGIELCDVYGMSETTGPITMSVPGITRDGSIGIPIIDVKFGEGNEIYVKGKSIFEEYYNNKEETKKSFTDDGWFKTGDIGAMDEDGFMYITGRSKDLIITAGGENISPIPIEHKLKEKIGYLFDHIVVVGDQRKFLSVLLVPKYKSTTGNKLHNSVIGYGPDLNSNSELKNIIDDALDEVNNEASSNANKVRKWIIIDQNFSIGNELTPTLKLRRSIVQNKYKKEIDTLY